MGAHLVKMRKGRVSKLYAALRKYGPDSFSVTTLMQCTDDDHAYQNEQRLISLLKPQYNLTDGGKGTFGRKMEEWQRRAISKHNKGNTWTRGYKKTPEHIAAIIASKRARGLTARELAAKKVAAAGSRIKNGRPVICIETGMYFVNQKDAAKFALVSGSSAINRAVNRPDRTANGFHFVTSIEQIRLFAGRFISGRHP